MNIGEKIKELRLSKNMNQNDLSKILDKSRPTITAYETNDRQPDIDTLVKIADYFEVTLDYLTGRTAFKTVKDEIEGLDYISYLKENINTKHEKLNDMDITLLSDLYKCLYSFQDSDKITYHSYYSVLMLVTQFYNLLFNIFSNQHEINSKDFMNNLMEKGVIQKQDDNSIKLTNPLNLLNALDNIDENTSKIQSNITTEIIKFKNYINYQINSRKVQNYQLVMDNLLATYEHENKEHTDN